MIGQPHWFTRRKYGGWGLFPVTWQGWLYVTIFVLLAFASQYVPGLSENGKIIFIGAIAVILFADTMDIMIRMRKDEREIMHEAIAERNALWTVIIVLAAGVAYQGAQSAAAETFKVDPVILIAIGAAVVVKAISNLYLDKND
jgi:uncharacterized PurR-regulated membrane protein YhhQ (DUF165 family)